MISFLLVYPVAKLAKNGAAPMFFVHFIVDLGSVTSNESQDLITSLFISVFTHLNLIILEILNDLFGMLIETNFVGILFSGMDSEDPGDPKLAYSNGITFPLFNLDTKLLVTLLHDALLQGGRIVEITCQ